MAVVAMFRFALLVYCFIFSNVFAQNDSLPSVEVSQGKIIGVTMQSTFGRNFSAFFGIPYGQVTRRFDVPQPAEPWTGDLNATASDFTHICYQYEYHIHNDVIGTEDCLNLNVYTPRIPRSSDDVLLPVMVYIYGGSFIVGFNLPLKHGPQHFMDKDIVLVIMNYRTGFLGFLSTGDDAAQGNAGLWDQRLALQWVQDNIFVFGGDKDRVTIFGESAGAAAVTFHLLSPMSTGLFHGAIIQSGSALCSWALDEHPLDNAIFLAKQLNCSFENTYDLVECLRTKDPKDITFVNDLLTFKIGPVVEVGNNIKFIPDHPYLMFRNGEFTKVPVIIGVVLDEGVHFYPVGQRHFHDTKEKFVEQGLKKAIGMFYDDDFSEGPLSNTTLFNEIVDVYYKDIEEPSSAVVEGIEMVGDIFFNACADITIKLLTAQDIPVFSYVFEYSSNITSITTFTGKPDVPHAAELKYIFDRTALHLKYSDEHLEFINSLVTMWTNFADHGDPSLNGSVSVSWDPTTKNGSQFLRIGKEMWMDENYIPERINVSTKLNKAYLEYQLA